MAEYRALVVEDDPGVQKVLVRWITAFEYEVEAVANADLALEAIERNLPVVIVADIMMPGKSGLWLLEQVKSRWPLLPVVMVSGAQSEQMIREARKLGAVDFVPKPFAREMLYQAILRATAA